MSRIQFCREVEKTVSGDGDPGPAGRVGKFLHLIQLNMWYGAMPLMWALVWCCRQMVKIKDQSWPRPAGDTCHINVVELHAAVKGLILATRWNVEVVWLMIDSKSVVSWLHSVINNVCVKIKGPVGVCVLGLLHRWSLLSHGAETRDVKPVCNLSR